MESFCIACKRGPSGIEGHADLRVQAVGVMLSFKCGRCDALWSRAHRRNGQFVWNSIGERTAASPWIGVIVPQSAKLPMLS